MSLSSGSQFGPFEVASLLGAGAMGEVYRARDTRLNRGVALKVLPHGLAQDAERLSRLKREAQVLASLNHPAVAAIYGFEEIGGVYALVLELVEGPTLAERIARGPLPTDEALSIARQIADALEAAHEAGIVHRDLKPANVKVSDDGAVKVLDFGLAKALVENSFTSVDASQSPTLSLNATGVGMMIGTVTYMAPEQARGKTADRRADIWAFGCVLYEMLTGRRAFEGEVISETLAMILRGEPDWTALPPSTPRPIQRLLRRCLEKDRRERLQAIGDARLEIKEALAQSGEPAPLAPVASAPSSRRGSTIAAAAGAAIIAAAGTWFLKPSAPATASGVTRSVLAVQPFDRRSPPPAGENRVPINRRDRTAIALSPDGRMVVFRATDDRGEQLWVRALDTLEIRSLPGSDGAESPVFSPDGAWIAFRAGAELKKIPAAGGVASTIARIPGAGNAPRIYGASWGDGDVILFATDDGIWRVGAGGGSPQRVTQPASNEYRHTLPYVLPGSKAVLFTITTAAFRWDDARIVVRDLASGEQKVLIENGLDPRYVSSGHLLFFRAGALMSVPFDAGRLEITGTPVARLQGVMQAINTGNTGNESGGAQVAISRTGSLVYATGGTTPEPVRSLAWLDRTGKAEPINLPERGYSTPRLSPDGSRIAVTVGPDGERRVWVHDIQRGGLAPVTATSEFAFWNVWSPDGLRLAFAATSTAMAIRSADGTGAADVLSSSRLFAAPSSWSRDGRVLAWVGRDAVTAGDVWIQDLSDPQRPAKAILQTTADEGYPEFSPDGHWLAYVSNPAGRAEVFVQPHPGPGPRVQVSIEGGHSPAWRGDGAELFFVVPRGQGVTRMMAVTVRATGTTFSVDVPRTLFEGRFAFTNPVRGYDVTPDGRRFLMVQQKDPPPQPPVELVLVENWVQELTR